VRLVDVGNAGAVGELDAEAEVLVGEFLVLVEFHAVEQHRAA
jgi:hypothetical protein